MTQRQPRAHNEKHLQFIRGLPCLVCKNNLTIDAAHIRYSDLGRGKRAVGVGEKPDDKWTVPLCRNDHTMQHSIGERSYWEGLGIDPIAVAQKLYAVSGDHEQGCRIVCSVSIANIMSAG